MDQESLSHDSAMISTNRRMRTRMSGGVGAGGEKPPATRLAHLSSSKLQYGICTSVFLRLCTDCYRVEDPQPQPTLRL